MARKTTWSIALHQKSLALLLLLLLHHHPAASVVVVTNSSFLHQSSVTSASLSYTNNALSTVNQLIFYPWDCFLFD